jgi:G3E family GTPase
MSSNQGLPITIVTGFLGAGRTTLIFRLVTARHRERIGVIVGDLLDTAIDGKLLSAVVEAVDSVATSTGDCAHVVRALDRMHRLIPTLDRIVVETSGLDDPQLLRDAINHDLGFAHVDAVIALADAAEPVGDHHSQVRR